MTLIGVVALVAVLGFVVAVVFGWGRRRAGDRTYRETEQEHRVEEIAHSSERYRAVAAHLEIKARERQRERERRLGAELERQYEVYARRRAGGER